jgi:hypothetical protein
MSNVALALCKPAGVFKRMKLSDIQCDAGLLVPPTEIFIDVTYNKNPAPAAFKNIAPDDGAFLFSHGEIPKGWRNASDAANVVVTETKETTTSGPLRFKRDNFTEMRESLSHMVASADEKPPNIRARRLESQTPNPDPTTVISAAAVVMMVGLLSSDPKWAEKKWKVAFVQSNLAAALDCNDTAKLTIMPSEGGELQVTEVSLCHWVEAQELKPIRAFGDGFAFEKYLPRNRTAVSPLAP